MAASLQDENLVGVAEKIYQELNAKGFEPLLDDRDLRLGFKLKDSDLIGIPYKLIVGKTFTQEGKVEIESRQGVKELIPLDALADWATTHLRHS